MSKKIVAGVGVAILAIAILVTLGSSGFLQVSSKTVGPDEATLGKTSVTPEAKTVSLINERTTVDAGSFVVYSFSAPKDATDARLRGNFTADGDGINVFVADKTIMDQWNAGKKVFFSGNVYYSTTDPNTGEHPLTNSGTVDIPLYKMNGSVKGETLYLVFNNKDDAGHAKQVDANFDLSYTILKSSS